MHWQDRVRQALKQKDVEMALLEFSMHQQKKENVPKDAAALNRKQKRQKVKTKENPDSSAQLTPSSSDAGSDTGNVSDNDAELDQT
jgi:hypothetical protein